MLAFAADLDQALSLLRRHDGEPTRARMGVATGPVVVIVGAAAADSAQHFISIQVPAAPPSPPAAAASAEGAVTLHCDGGCLQLHIGE